MDLTESYAQQIEGSTVSQTPTTTAPMHTTLQTTSQPTTTTAPTWGFGAVENKAPTEDISEVQLTPPDTTDSILPNPTQGDDGQDLVVPNDQLQNLNEHLLALNVELAVITGVDVATLNNNLGHAGTTGEQTQASLQTQLARINTLLGELVGNASRAVDHDDVASNSATAGVKPAEAQNEDETDGDDEDDDEDYEETDANEPATDAAPTVTPAPLVQPAAAAPAVPSIDHFVQVNRADATDESPECRTCMDTPAATETIYLECGHVWCHDCLNAYFITVFEDRDNFPPRCCQRHGFNLGNIQMYLEDEVLMHVMEKWEEWSATDPTYCAKEGCGAFIEVHQTNGTMGMCLKCKEATCTTCKNPVSLHDPAKPEEHPVKMETEDDKQNADLASKEGWKKCPNTKCAKYVERTEGCDTMKCKCGQQFCYRCGNGFDNPYPCTCNGQNQWVHDTQAWANGADQVDDETEDEDEGESEGEEDGEDEDEEDGDEDEEGSEDDEDEDNDDDSNSEGEDGVQGNANIASGVTPAGEPQVDHDGDTDMTPPNGGW
jgi:hypothetical protein